MRRLGKKGREWIRERAKLIKEAVAEGRIEINEAGNVVGICEDCGHWHNLTPHHEEKRSQGGKHTKKNIVWICNEPPCWCHNKRDQQGDPMGKKKKTKKPAWAIRHKCRSCGFESAHYICPGCGKVSVK